MKISPKWIMSLFCLLISLSVMAQKPEDLTQGYPLSETDSFGKYLLRHQTYMQRNTDSSIFYLDKAGSVVDTNNAPELMAYLYHKSMYWYRTTGNYKQIKADCKYGLELATTSAYPYYQVKFNIILALCSSRQKAESYTYNQAAYTIAKANKIDNDLVGIVFNIVLNEIDNENYEYARTHLKEIRSKLANPNAWLRFYLIYARVAEDIEVSLTYIDSAEAIVDEMNYTVFKEHIYVQRAELYNDYGCHNEALYFFNKRDSLYADSPEDKTKHQYSFVKSRIYYYMGEYKKAKFYFDAYRNSHLGNTQELGVGPDYYAYQLHKALKDTSRAFRYLENWETVLTNQNQMFKDSVYHAYRTKYEMDKAQSDLLEKDTKIKFYQLEIVFLIMGFVILLLIIFIVFQVKHMRKQKEMLETQLILDNEKKMNRIRKHFIENITHEIRTPITLIQGVFENSIQSGTGNQELLGIGLKNTKQLAYDMEQILEFVKTDTTVNPLVVSEVYVLPFFLEMIDNFKVNLHSKGLALTMTHNLTEDTRIFTDRNKLGMILSNYLSNAIKYSNTSNKIYLSVTIKNGVFTFSVKDYANALSRSELPFVFDRFFRGEQHKYNSGGHGIGLSICKELSKILEGEVYAEVNEVEKSTCFYFQKKVNVENAEGETEYIEIAETPSERPVVHNTEEVKPKLLLVDDNELMIRFYLNVLAPYYDCDFVYNGKDALKKLSTTAYQCLVLDVMMPEMDGIELLGNIREQYPDKDIPAIFVTAKDFDETRHAAFNLGVHDFVSKPFILQELLARIANVIRNSVEYLKEEEVKEEHTIIQEEHVEEVDVIDDNTLLKRVTDLIHTHMGEEDFGVEKLATMAFYSKRHFSRKMKMLTGLSPRELILELRLKKAYQILKNSQSVRIGDVQKTVGIKSTAHFNKAFKSRFGVTPKQIRNTI